MMMGDVQEMKMFERFFNKEEEAAVVGFVPSLKCVPVDIDSILYSDYEKALAEVGAAKNRFEQVVPGYEDVAILELSAAEARYEAVLREVRAQACRSN
jgi:hypothetical protein